MISFKACLYFWHALKNDGIIIGTEWTAKGRMLKEFLKEHSENIPLLQHSKKLKFWIGDFET
jgi:hypothetical protein